LRKASQCELQVNAFSSLTDGLTKRAPLQWLAELSATSLGTVHASLLDFGDQNHFILVLVDNDLFIYNTAGTLMTLAFPNGKGYLNVVDATADFSVVSVEDVAYVTNKTVLTDNTAAVASGTFQGEVQLFSSLPGTPAANDVYRIVGDDTVVLTGYYVKWDATNSVWKECAFPTTKTTFDPALMPHKIVWDGASTFTFQQETWGLRAAGDLTSLPSPNFLGRAIRDVFFFRNRLGFLAGEYCVLSQSGPDYQNFYRQSATAQLDNDRIDVRAANVKVSTLDWGIPFNRQLLTFSEKTQFVMGTGPGQLLTPTTASIDVATGYSSNSIAKPQAVGGSVYFPSESPQALFTQLREYFVSDDTEIANTAEDTTGHVPSYIPAGVFQMAIAENDDVLFLATTGDTTRLYVYKYFWVEDQKAQSSWSYWEFDSGYDIKGMVVVDSSVYIIAEWNSKVHLEKLDLVNDPSLIDLGFTCYLDKRVDLLGVYNAGGDYTEWTLPYDVNGKTFEIVKGGDWTSSFGSLISGGYAGGATTWRAPGDHSDYNCYLGLPYEMRYRFSEIFVREGNDPDSGSPILDSVLTLRTMNLRYSQTGYMRAEVTPRKGATPYEYTFSGKVIGEITIGTPSISTGTFKFPVAADSRRVTLDLINYSHMPSSIVSAEWAGNFNLRSGRR
jgi:hypothetical protein